MMTFQKTATSAAALSLCLGGSAAFADLTAQEVWQDWQGYMAGFGYELEGNESSSGNVLTVSDLKMSLELPDDAGTMSMTIPEFRFTDNGDGTVTMTLPEVMPVSMSMTTMADENMDMTFNYTTKAFAMVASGSAEALSYNYTADEMGIELSELIVDGEAVDMGTAMFNVAQMAGSSDVKTGNIRNIVQKISTGPITYDLDFADPATDGRVMVKGEISSTAFEGSGDYPINANTSDINAMLAAGFGFDGGFTHSGSTMNFELTEYGDTTQIKSTSESGAFSVAMDTGRLLYDVSSNNVSVDMAGGDIPFPVQIGMAQSAFKLLMPVMSGDQEQDFAFSLTLGDFTLSDMIWGIFDPAGQLPRDPATVALDLTGKAKLFLDILDPEQMESAGASGEMPGELNAVSLNALTVRAAGAELTGNGAFTFDNADLETYMGFPAPDGAVDLQLSGANGLIDNLVGMGLLPEEQAMGARMMMGLFAVPGAGDDSLTSKIEVKADGQILANGQRLK